LQSLRTFLTNIRDCPAASQRLANWGLRLADDSVRLVTA
jgi:hypothetical protein